MDGKSVIKIDTYIEEMREMTQTMLREVAEAVNKAPDGAWINGSEMQVRDALAVFRRKAYEKALQMRTDGAQAAFSPGGCSNGQAFAEQGS